MRFFPRLVLSNLLVIVLAVGSMFIAAELLAPSFYRDHVERMAAMMTGMVGSTHHELRTDLVAGLRSTLNRALLASLPLAGGVALVTAWWMSRGLGRSVHLLDEGSRSLAQGNYSRRLPVTGRDELSDLAHNLNVMAGTLEKVEQGRVELIGNVAHELRAPLAALRGYADAMQDGVMTPEHAAQAISREVAAMDRLIRDLSLVSRVEAGRVELHLKPLDPAVLLSAVKERFSLSFEEKGVALQVTGNDLPLIRADEERTLQVLTNLLSNALRHTPVGGQVSIHAEVRQPYLKVTVEDSGTGIPVEQLPRIFERFYRADPARSRTEGGSGVGLTIARGLVEAMHGEMQVSSEEGDGSSFSFTIPLLVTPALHENKAGSI
ncbi:HAMP domain-containing protein [Deinococcus cavernae]|uniref:histidine kinase n=1 Tax=Deinococcus cavernae TaxID=2320857 RepID=A0A418UZK2_9DEIO|nr:ATP-binding protein [Deinococcus cavernae]RJF68933.1 HAMP domain-containing protein [Deinococcus cavernae]